MGPADENSRGEAEGKEQVRLWGDLDLIRLGSRETLCRYIEDAQLLSYGACGPPVISCQQVAHEAHLVQGCDHSSGLGLQGIRDG